MVVTDVALGLAGSIKAEENILRRVWAITIFMMTAAGKRGGRSPPKMLNKCCKIAIF